MLLGGYHHCKKYGIYFNDMEEHLHVNGGVGVELNHPDDATH